MAIFEAMGLRQTRALFLNRMQREMQNTWVGLLTTFLNSDQSHEDYAWMGQVRSMEEWIGQRTESQAKDYSLTIRNKKFETGVGIKEEDLRRDKLGVTSRQVGKMARRAALLPNKLLTELIEANGNAYDGNAFFSDRTSADIVRINTTMSTNVADPAKMTTAEAEDVVLSSVERILGAKDDQGEPLYEGPMDFAVMLPVNHWRAIATSLKDDFTSAGVSNSLKGMVSGGELTVRHFVNPRLAATDKVYLFRLDPDYSPFLWQEEYAPQMKMKGIGSDYNVDTGKVFYGVDCSCNGSLGEPGSAILHTLT